MNTTIIYFLIVAFLMLVVFLFSRKTRLWLKHICIVILLLLSLDIIFFGMGGLRSHILEEKEGNKSKDFISGMVERDHRIFPRRVQLLFCVCGLAFLALAKGKEK